MSFETTTCISKKHYSVLIYYTEKYNLTFSMLVTSFIRYIAENHKISFTVNRRIKYRSRQGKDTWRRIHIMLTPYDYEIILDMKKVGKMSLAKIIDYGIENFLQVFVKNVLEKQNTDNYLYANYHFEITTEDDIFSYSVYWGLPQHVLKKITNQTQKFVIT